MKKENVVEKEIKTACGFTLIELLVVVLIIAILATVALPQYQLAVNKTRSARLLPFMKSIQSAQRVYALANGQYAASFKDLDIEPSGTTSLTDTTAKYGDYRCLLSSFSDGIPYSLSCYDRDWRLENYFAANFAYCWAHKDKTMANKVCLSLCGATSMGKHNDTTNVCTINL